MICKLPPISSCISVVNSYKYVADTLKLTYFYTKIRIIFVLVQTWNILESFTGLLKIILFQFEKNIHHDNGVKSFW